jgi:hypothetical protein
MAYNNFTLASVKHQFELKILDAPFCELLPTADPQPEFLTIFKQWLPLAQRAKSEKAKSELLVSPILTELRRLVHEPIQLFSGEEFNVDRELGLNGFCDFLLSKSTADYSSHSQMTITHPFVQSGAFLDCSLPPLVWPSPWI